METVALDWANGRPSLAVTDDHGDLRLRWMIIGHVEAFEVWLVVPVSEGEANQIIENPPINVEDWVVGLSSRQVDVDLLVNDRLGLAEKIRLTPARGVFEQVLDSAQRLAAELARTHRGDPVADVPRELATYA